MKTCLLGYRVRAFVPGEGWHEDRFALRQAAIECAQLCIATPNAIGNSNHAYVEEITREQVEASIYAAETWIEDEQFKVIWEPEEA